MRHNLKVVIPAKPAPARFKPGAGIQDLLIFLFFSITFFAPLHSFADEKWQGVDETVVGRVAAEKGREEKPLCPLQGDARLFAFLGAGVIGGFALGYFYRDQLSKKRTKG